MSTPKSVKNRQKQITEAQLSLARDQQAKQSQLFNSLVGPALRGEAPAYFLNSILPGLDQGFQGARENLAQFFGSSGQGNSGITAGPLANLFSKEAMAGADAKNQAILQALTTGFQGNQVYNPTSAFYSAGQSNAQLAQMSQNPWLGVLGGIAGSALGAFNPIGRATSLFSRTPSTSGADFLNELGGYSGPRMQ